MCWDLLGGVLRSAWLRYAVGRTGTDKQVAKLLRLRNGGRENTKQDSVLRVPELVDTWNLLHSVYVKRYFP